MSARPLKALAVIVLCTVAVFVIGSDLPSYARVLAGAVWATTAALWALCLSEDAR